MKDDRSHTASKALDQVDKPAATVPDGDTTDLAAAPAIGDEVRAPSDARVIPAVTWHAQHPPIIRHDVVERMRAALANGEVGNDARALADAILDRLVGAVSPRPSDE
jgi:hypothetical protein